MHGLDWLGSTNRGFCVEQTIHALFIFFFFCVNKRINLELVCFCFARQEFIKTHSYCIKLNERTPKIITSSSSTKIENKSFLLRELARIYVCVAERFFLFPRLFAVINPLKIKHTNRKLYSIFSTHIEQNQWTVFLKCAKKIFHRWSFNLN